MRKQEGLIEQNSKHEMRKNPRDGSRKSEGRVVKNKRRVKKTRGFFPEKKKKKTEARAEKTRGFFPEKKPKARAEKNRRTGREKPEVTSQENS